MPLFRIAAAAGVLFVVAPEQTREAALAIFGFAASQSRQLPDPAEQARVYCSENVEKCASLARDALRHSARP